MINNDSPRSLPRKPTSHLLNILQTTRNFHPNFALFLGAGASVESGITTAAEMITKWRTKYHELYGNKENVDDFLKRHHWHKRPGEYSALFEALYDEPSQRREFIEDCIGDAQPGWGYIYLVDLIRQGVFNTIFTTNFDDLLNEACYLFTSDVRPIVCAHDSSIKSVRVTSKRPKIIKLHGDFLFDSIKNTARELESLEDNMRAKFRQFAGEYGLIVVGYGGNDRSIMDTLDALLRQEEAFPHGVYWCVRDSNIPQQVEHLARFPKFHLVTIKGFDSLFSELHHELSPRQHPVFSKPYEVISLRFNALLSRLRGPGATDAIHPGLADDILRLGNAVRNNANQKPEIQLPGRMLAWMELTNGNTKEAVAYMLQYATSDDMLHIDTHEKNKDYKFLFEIIDGSLSSDQKDCVKRCLSRDFADFPMCGWSFDHVVVLMNKEIWDLAEYLLNVALPNLTRAGGMYAEYAILNLLQIKVHQCKELTADERVQLTSIASSSGDSLSRYGAECLLGNSDAAVKLIAENNRGGLIGGVRIETVLEWPISKLLGTEKKEEIASIAKRSVK